MKRAFVVVGLISFAALAASVGSSLGTTSGTGAQTFYTGTGLQAVGMQCPYQVVAWKKCQGSGGQLDSGLGGCSALTTANGTITDFSNPDPLQINMNGGDRIQVVNIDAGSSVCRYVNLGP